MGAVGGAVAAIYGVITSASAASIVSLGAAAYGAYASLTADTGSTDDVSTEADKTAAESADQLDAAELGDGDSEKLARKNAKAKFKIAQDAESTSTAETTDTGVNITTDNTKSSTGVQI